MSNWKTYKIGDLYNVGSGLSKSRDEFGFGYPFVTFKDVFYNFFIPAELESLANTTEKERTTCSVKRGDIFLTRTSETMHELGMSAVALKDYESATFNGFTKRLRLKNKVLVEIDPVFIGYYFRTTHIRNQIGMHATMTTRASLNSTAINSIELTIPEIEVQKRIGKILKSIDDKIELNRRMNQTLEQMAQTLFRQYFVDGIDEENLPEGWFKRLLGELVEITSSKRIFLNDYVPEGIPFYRGKEIIQLNKTGIISTKLFITEEKFNTIKMKFGVPKEGDILLTSVGTIGIPYLVNKDDEFYFKDGNITWIKSYLDFVKPFFLYQWLISEAGQSSIDNITIGSTQKAVTIQSLKTMQVIVPPKELHDKVCNQLEALRSKINHNIKEIRTLIQTRDSLLPKLMSGEIDVMQTQAADMHEPILS